MVTRRNAVRKAMLFADAEKWTCDEEATGPQAPPPITLRKAERGHVSGRLVTGVR
jgi:hypothetical protein